MNGNEVIEKAKKTARAFYAREAKKNPDGYPYSPADATRDAEKKTGVPFSRLVPVVAAIYYEENGKRSPIAGTGAALAKKIRTRRDAGGRLARWEVISASLVAGENGRESWPLPTIRAMYEKGGGSLETSYTGRGTRVAAPATRTDETAEAVA
jgi:hypothetical protein